MKSVFLIWVFRQYDYQTLLFLSFMMVGDPFGTKTSVIQCLADTLTLLKEQEELGENKVNNV